MLAKKPAHRYQNAAELLKDLRALQVEGLNDDWTPEADSADASQLATLAEARNAATQQLDIVMKEESLVFRRGLRGWWFGLAVAVAFAVGAAMAGVLRPASLLDVDSDEKPGVERKATAEAQFRYAFDVGTEAAFAAVEQYFPPALSTENELYVNKAKLQLAYLYRESDRLEEAISILRDLVSQGSDTALQASAHVELANIHVRRGEMVDAQKSLLQLPGLLKQMNRLSPRDQQEWGQLVPAVLRRDFELALQSQVEGSQGRSPGPKKGAVEK
jgi:tetratricopeptide (TPR) repeat protein